MAATQLPAFGYCNVRLIAWTSSEGSAIFTYLKLYACRYNSLLKSPEVGKIIIGLSQQDFWSAPLWRLHNFLLLDIAMYA
jgi:hypothetical protein